MLRVMLDIVFLFAAVLTVLMFFGITGKGLFGYTKGAITKGSRSPIAYLILSVAVTAGLIFIAVDGFETLGLARFPAIIGVVPLVWYDALMHVLKLKLSKRREKATNVARTVISFAVLSLLIAGSILSNSDRPLWQRLAPTLGGLGIGAVILVLSTYMRKRRGNKFLCQEDKKDSPL